jgi:hypothetical protein
MAERDGSETIKRSPMERFAKAYSEALLHTRTNDADMLAAHGMVQQQLAMEADRLGHLLQAEATQSTRLTQILPMPNFPVQEGS